MQVYDEIAERRKENERKDKIRKRTNLFKIRLRYLAGEITKEEYIQYNEKYKESSKSTDKKEKKHSNSPHLGLLNGESVMQKIFFQNNLIDSDE